jgi:phosphinothricin acetyltransferase
MNDAAPQIIDCAERHLPAIRAILNDAILHTTALYDYAPRTPRMIEEWFARRQQEHRPVIGIEAADGTLAGFASYGTFRAFPGYKYTVEHSVYVDTARRGQGIGQTLMRELITRAEAQQLHTLIGAIDAENAASIRFHVALGFTHCGTLREAGYKFGRWLDVVFYQLILRTPDVPTEE